MTNNKQIEVSEKVRDLLSRIPIELLTDKDLEFEILRTDETKKQANSKDSGLDDVYININIGKDHDVRAHIGFDFKAGKDIAHFTGPYEDCNYYNEDFYCNKTDSGDLKLKDSDKMKVCPYVASCDKVKKFIDTYKKIYENMRDEQNPSE